MLLATVLLKSAALWLRATLKSYVLLTLATYATALRTLLQIMASVPLMLAQTANTACTLSAVLAFIIPVADKHRGYTRTLRAIGI